jgi:predicted O-methyltransferase YrrM
MRETLKKITPAPLWQSAKVVATALRLRKPHVMLTSHDIAMLEKWGTNRRWLLEIGVFEGGSALILRRVMHPDATLTVIDPFVPDSISGMRGSLAISKLVVNREKRGRVNFIRDFSFNVAKNWSAPIDFLFIDGDHAEEACRRDFEDWEKHVTRDGVILFHDARLGQPAVQEWMGAEGPTNVVNELFRGGKNLRWRIADEGGSVVAVQRK